MQVSQFTVRYLFSRRNKPPADGKMKTIYRAFGRLAMTPMTDNERSELLRRAALENAIASNEIEGVVFTPAMRDLLERSSLGLVTEEEFAREAMVIARSDK